jgi:tRNA 5-methylaminomethyl-2-thiouridine biosynthesis bifunctional protein
MTQGERAHASARPCQPLITTDQTITVIGSGIAGAATARALADVGYQVRVLDTGDTPAAGASGLPAGLVAPHASPDDAPVSRLSRSGIRAMHQAMQRLLTLGQDWGATGVTEHRLPGKTRKGGVPSAWNTPEYTASHDWTRPLSDVSTSLRHSKAAWVKPAELVKQLLAHPHIQWQGQTTVDRLSHDGHQWTLHTSTQELIKTDQLILAAGPHSSRLLKTFTDSAPPIQPLRGQLSWGLMSQIDQAPIPETPTNGNGSFIANVPTDSGLAWYVGSTFDRHRDQPVEDEQDHIENWQRLSALLPETAAAIQPLFTEKQVKAWVRVRAAVPDRLPLVGQLTHVPTGLWMVTALGSRGLSLGVLCGELLTAQWAGEPLAIESKLIHKLNASRFTN